MLMNRRKLLTSAAALGAGMAIPSWARAQEEHWEAPLYWQRRDGRWGHFTLAGLKETTTGDTLCAANAPIILERMEFPEPVIHVAIEPKTKDKIESIEFVKGPDGTAPIVVVMAPIVWAKRLGGPGTSRGSPRPGAIP